MRVAILTTDNRENFHQYDLLEPFFGTAPTALLEGFDGLKDCEVHVVCCVQKPVQSPSHLFPNIHYHSVVVPKWGWLKSGYAGCILATRKKLKEIQPDVVHGQGTERNCAISAVFSGFPNVVTIHGNMRQIANIGHASPFSFNWLAARLETFTLPKADAVFCNSAYTKQLVGTLSKKTWDMPNPLRGPFFERVPQREASPVPRFISIGVIESRKCQCELVRVAARLHEKGLKFCIDFVGNFSQEERYVAEFKELIHAAEPKGYARYSGVKNSQELISMMDEADALIHVPKEEAFGLVVAEALARNLNLFGFREGGIPDITAGVDGVSLVKTLDFEALEKSLEAYLRSPRVRSTNAHQIMAERYHPSVIARRHLEAYRTLVPLKNPLR